MCKWFENDTGPKMFSRKKTDVAEEKPAVTPKKSAAKENLAIFSSSLESTPIPHHSMGHGSAPIDDDSHVEEMSPIKAKNPSKRASNAKKNDTKEKEPPKDWTMAEDIALCRA
ncbi:hypothetical protein Tco_0827957 [Tanacetum coccineum]